MEDQPLNSTIAERARIQEAYAKRQRAYEDSFFSLTHLFIVQERERRILEILKQASSTSLNTTTILEIGCGNGFWLREFMKWGAQPQHLFGVDLLFDRITEATHLCPKEAHIHCGNVTSLSFKDASFDLVLQSTVFTSVLEPRMKQQIAREMLRVVKRDGLILWYDFRVNNPWNPDVKGVNKREINGLFPNCQIELSRITLAPPLVRMLAPYSWLICYVLERFKVFNTHYVGIIRKS